jgi:predicted dienelactone hydrolase
MVASHGFVIVSPDNSMVDAPAMKASLDWILAQNDAMDGPYYHKLDVKHVAMGGHSLGSIATFDEEATETRLTTTIHIAGGSFDMMGSSKVKTPTAYICGQMDLDLASPNCKSDFDAVKDKPTYFVQMAGVNHVDAAREGLPAIVAWLRWYLAGEDRKSMFVGAGCDFCKDKWANATTKNF